MKINIPTYTKLLTFCIISSLIHISCVKEYWPELEEWHENLLTVEGKITNEIGPYTVLLSRSIAVDKNPEEVPESGAIVSITDNEDNIETLIEIEKGKYITSQFGMQGVVGRKYKITIKTSDGSTYESAYEELRAPVDIDELSATIETKSILTNGDLSIEDGVQFYVLFSNNNNTKNFFYWELAETWEYHSTQTIDYQMFKDDNRESIRSVEDLHPVDDSRFLYYCYNNDIMRETFTFNSKYSNASNSLIPLSFLSFKNEKSYIKYKLEVNQLSISENANVFLKKIKEQESDQSGLYTTQPVQIRGNIYNINNENEPVLGYFFIAGISAKNILIRPPNGYTFPRESCAIPDTDNIISKLQTKKFSHYPVYITMVPKIEQEEQEGENDVFEPAIFNPYCIDCTARGGDTIRPDYWSNDLLYPLPEKDLK